MRTSLQQSLSVRTVILGLFAVLLLVSCAGGGSPFNINRGSGEGGDIPSSGGEDPVTLPGAIDSPADIKNQSSPQYRAITTLSPYLTSSGSSQSAHYHHEDSIISMGSTFTKGDSK